MGRIKDQWAAHQAHEQAIGQAIVNVIHWAIGLPIGDMGKPSGSQFRWPYTVNGQKMVEVEGTDHRGKTQTDHYNVTP